nr:hypothetical protein [uncultured Cohaesibacter sp.]
MSTGWLTMWLKSVSWGAGIDFDGFVRQSGFAVDPILRRETFADLGIHETLGRVLELIEQGQPEKANATLDQLINPVGKVGRTSCAHPGGI